MKRYGYVALALVILGGSATAAPSVSLSGRMFIWSPRHHVDGTGLNYAQLNTIDWNAGTPGTETFLAQIANTTTDSIAFVQSRNAQLMTTGNVLGVVGDNFLMNRYSLWEFDRTTGAATERYDGNTQGQIGYTPCIGIDPDDDRVVTSISTGWNNYRLLTDTTDDGNYDTSTSLVVNDQPPHGMTCDAHMYNGICYSIGKNAWADDLIGASSATAGVNTAKRWSDDGSSYAEGNPGMYLWAGDPDGDQHTDVYFSIWGSGDPTRTRSILHYEDDNDDLYFQPEEFRSQYQAPSGQGPRDLDVVTDGTNWMIVFSAGGSRTLMYINLLDNGAMDTSDVDTLGIDLGAPAAGSQFILMDMEAPIPEPATILLVGTAALGAIALRRRRRMR